MKGTRAALRYAKAALSLAKDQGKMNEVNDDMLLIDQTISENKDLQIMIKSPIIKSAVKKSVLGKVFYSKVSVITQKVIELLIENNRIELLQLVAKEYTIIFDYYKGDEVAHVTTAIPLTKELEKKVLKSVSEISDQNITLKNIVDPSIIGGFILRVGDKQLDSSVTGILNSMLQDFEGNHFISKL